MSMILPKLWSENTSAARITTLSHLKKYEHLIKWKEAESILEFGFADGKNSSITLGPLLPLDYKEFVASDSSAEMVEYAKQHCTIPRSTFVHMDIGSNRIPTNFYNRFDHIFGFFVMHMVKNPRQALKNIHSMLKPGGTTFLNFFERIPVDDVFERLSRHPKWKDFGQEEMISSYFYSKSPKEEYIKDIREASFKDYIFEVEKGSHIYPSEEQFNNVYISINATLAKIPKNHYDDYIKDYLEELKRGESVNITCKDGKENIGINFTCFLVVATK